MVPKEFRLFVKNIDNKQSDTAGEEEIKEVRTVNLISTGKDEAGNEVDVKITLKGNPVDLEGFKTDNYVLCTVMDAPLKE